MNQILISAAPPNPTSAHRPRGKIGRFPKKIRDHLNQMIQDGVPYKDIKEQLGEHGAALTEDNISE
jgi:hypothetical protein